MRWKNFESCNRNGRWIHSSSLKLQIGKRETQTRPWKVKCLSAKAQKTRFSNCRILFFSSLEQYPSHISWPMHNQISLLRGVLHKWKRNLSFTWKQMKIFIVNFCYKNCRRGKDIFQKPRPQTFRHWLRYFNALSTLFTYHCPTTAQPTETA